MHKIVATRERCLEKQDPEKKRELIVFQAIQQLKKNSSSQQHLRSLLVYGFPRDFPIYLGDGICLKNVMDVAKMFIALDPTNPDVWDVSFKSIIMFQFRLSVDKLNGLNNSRRLVRGSYQGDFNEKDFDVVEMDPETKGIETFRLLKYLEFDGVRLKIRHHPNYGLDFDLFKIELEIEGIGTFRFLEDLELQAVRLKIKQDPDYKLLNYLKKVQKRCRLLAAGPLSSWRLVKGYWEIFEEKPQVGDSKEPSISEVMVDGVGLVPTTLDEMAWYDHILAKCPTHAATLVRKGRAMIEAAEFFDYAEKLRGLYYVRQGLERDPSLPYLRDKESVDELSKTVLTKVVSDQTFVLDHIKHRLCYFEDRKQTSYGLYDELYQFCRDFFIEEVDLFDGQRIIVQYLRNRSSVVQTHDDNDICTIGSKERSFSTTEMERELTEVQSVLDAVQKSSKKRSDFEEVEKTRVRRFLKRYLCGTLKVMEERPFNSYDPQFKYPLMYHPPLLRKSCSKHSVDHVDCSRTQFKRLFQLFLVAKKLGVISEQGWQALQSRMRRDITSFGKSPSEKELQLFFITGLKLELSLGSVRQIIEALVPKPPVRKPIRRDILGGVIRDPLDDLWIPASQWRGGGQKVELESLYPLIGMLLGATLSGNERYTLPEMLRPYFGGITQVSRAELMAPYEAQSVDKLSQLKAGPMGSESRESWLDQIDEQPLDPVPYVALSRLMTKGETRCFPYYPDPLNRVELCLVALNVIPESVTLLLALKDFLTELMLDGERLYIYHPSIGQFRSWFSRIPMVSTFMSPMSPVIGQLSQMMTDVYGWMMGQPKVFAQLPNGEWVDAEDVGEMISRRCVEQEMVLDQIREEVGAFPLGELRLDLGQVGGFEYGEGSHV